MLHNNNKLKQIKESRDVAKGRGVKLPPG